jgi:hypothetical protein
MSAYEGEHTIFGLLGQANLTQNDVELLLCGRSWYLNILGLWGVAQCRELTQHSLGSILRMSGKKIVILILGSEHRTLHSPGRCYTT